MRPAAFAIAIVAAAAMPDLLFAQEPPARRGLWIGLGFGGGQVEHWSDQAPAVRATTVTASLRLGAVVVPAVHVGIEANGWLLEPSDFNDPTRGETVNETLFIVEIYRWPAKNLFVKAGYGWGEFLNKNPASESSRAFGALSLGIGYDIPAGRNLFVTLAADHTRGPAGSVLPPLSPVATGRRFRGWDVVVGLQYHLPLATATAAVRPKPASRGGRMVRQAGVAIGG